MLNVLQENTDKQLKKIRKMIHEQNENINKDRKYKKNQTNSGAEKYKWGNTQIYGN